MPWFNSNNILLATISKASPFSTQHLQSSIYPLYNRLQRIVSLLPSLPRLSLLAIESKDDDRGEGDQRCLWVMEPPVYSFHFPPLR